MFSFGGKQEKLCENITSIVDSGNFSHAYLIETNGLSYSYEFVISMIKYFFCIPNNKDIILCPDVRIISPDGDFIKKEQIVSLKNDFSCNSASNKYLSYVITDGSKLNGSSANSLLKFLEEPDSNVIAFIMVNSIYNVIPTILSRCQVLSMSLDDLDCFNFDVSKYVDFFINIESDCDLLYLSDLSIYRDNISELLSVGLYFYFDCLNIILNRKNIVFDKYLLNLKDVVKSIDTCDIIKKIDLINNFIMLNSFNVNRDLFFDNIIFSLGGVVND